MASYYPPTGFHFQVEFVNVPGMNSDTEQRFQEVSGLSYEVETEALREGGENRFEYKLPKRTKYPNLVLKRGLLKQTALVAWFKSALSTYYSALLYEFQPADLVVTLMDEEGAAVATWKVVQAYPLKWSISEFRASENALVVETLELAYQYFDRTL
jgi:phage tail-like protein